MENKDNIPQFVKCSNSTGVLGEDICEKQKHYFFSIACKS
mgnify:CR=1 FL=1